MQVVASLSLQPLDHAALARHCEAERHFDSKATGKASMQT